MDKASEILALIIICLGVGLMQLFVMISAFRTGRTVGEGKAWRTNYEQQAVCRNYQLVIDNQRKEFEKLAKAHKELKEQKGRILGTLRQMRRIQRTTLVASESTVSGPHTLSAGSIFKRFM